MNIDDGKQFAEYNEYLRDCDECATVPTVSGAFQWAWRSCESNKIKKMEIEAMEKAIEGAIKVLAVKITYDVKPIDVMYYAQAALNMAQALATLANTEKHLS